MDGMGLYVVFQLRRLRAVASSSGEFAKSGLYGDWDRSFVPFALHFPEFPHAVDFPTTLPVSLIRPGVL